jgi:hypothetical protein
MVIKINQYYKQTSKLIILWNQPSKPKQSQLQMKQLTHHNQAKPANHPNCTNKSGQLNQITTAK